MLGCKRYVNIVYCQKFELVNYNGQSYILAEFTLFLSCLVDFFLVDLSTACINISYNPELTVKLC